MPYHEKQTLHQTWIYVVLIAILGVFLWALIQQVFLGNPFGNHPVPDIILAITGIIPIGFLIILSVGKMHTIVTDKEIKVKITPFMFQWKHIHFSEILSYSSTTYFPIKDYGGWGIRLTLKGSRAYNVRKNKGVRIDLKNGRHIMIGSSHPDKLELAIQKHSSIMPARPVKEE
jgi:hypothetical protein